MTDLVTRLGALADTPHPTPQIQRALREAAAALSLLLKERDETPAGIYAGQLRVRIDDLEEERDGLKAKLAESEDELDDCNRRALSYFDRAEKAEAEAEAEAAALREALAVIAAPLPADYGWATVKAREALSQPGPGAALLDKLKRYEDALRDMATVTEDELRGASPLEIVHAIRKTALAALEEKP